MSLLDCYAWVSAHGGPARHPHSGFSVDTSVCIAAHDRAGLERLLRYCARPPFAMERLRKAGSELVYRCAKQHTASPAACLTTSAA